MKIKPKKLMTLLLSAMLTVSSLSLSSFSAFAEEGTTTAETNVSDSTVQTTGTIGSFIADEMKKSEEENSEAQQMNYAIYSMEYDAAKGLVDIDYISKANCTVFVGFYNDEGTELYSSITKNVKADDNGHVQLTVLNSLPEHYLVKTFLVGNHQNALCKAFVYEKCTKAMQEILAATTEKFEEENVINLDNGNDNNFIVVSDDAKHIKSTSESDTFDKTDESGEYHFSNINEIAKLKKDSIAVIEVPGDLLAFKVDTIKITGNTASIKPNDDVQVGEIFDFVKLNSEELQKEPISQPAPTNSNSDETMVSKRYNEKFDFSNLYTFYFRAEEDNGFLLPEKPKNPLDITATLTLGFSGSLEFYFSLDLDETFVDADITATAGFETLAQIKINKELTSIPIPLGSFPPSIVGLKITPELNFTITGKASVNTKCKFHFDLTNYLTVAEEPYRNVDISAIIDLGMTLKVGIDFLKKADMTLNPKFGIKASVSKNLWSEANKIDYKRHDCSTCTSIKGDLYINLSASVSVKFIKKHKSTMKIGEIGYPFVFTLNENGLSSGECQNYSYLMKYHVKDQNGKPIEGVKITSDGKQLLDNNGKTSIVTDKNGYAEFWVNISEMKDEVANITGTAPTKETDVFCIYGYYFPDSKKAMECNRTIELKNVEKKDDNNDDSSNDKSNESNILESGLWDKNTNLRYVLTKDGDLLISGEGVVTDWKLQNSENLSKIKQIIVVDAGKNGIEWDSFSKSSPVFVDISKCVFKDDTLTPLNYFGNKSKLETVVLPESLKSIIGNVFSSAESMKTIELPNGLEQLGFSGSGSYRGFVFQNNNTIEEIILPDTVTYIGDDTFYCCKNLKEVKLSSNLKEIGKYAFSGSGIESITIPANVKEINTYAFGDDTTRVDKIQCNDLKSVTIEGDFKGNSIFKALPSIERVCFCNKATTVNGSLFSDCKNLRYVSLNKEITAIQPYAFTGTSLEKITIYNPKCKLGASQDATYDIGNVIVPINTVIYGYTNSTAHQYALKYGNPFVPLDPETKVTTIAGTTAAITTTTTTTAETTTTAPVTTVYTYTSAVPDTDYILIAVKDDAPIKTETDADGHEITADAQQLKLLSPKNVLFFDQQTADSKNTVTFSFVVPKEENVRYILVGDFGSKKIDRAIYEDKLKDKPDEMETFENEYITPKENNEDITPKENKEVVYGDVNGDGNISMNDAVLIMQFIANPSKYGINGTEELHMTEEGLERADVAGGKDGVTAKDALAIQKYLLKLIDSLPEEA